MVYNNIKYDPQLNISIYYQLYWILLKIQYILNTITIEQLMDMLHQQRITQMIQRPGHPMEHGKHPLGLVVKNHVGFTNLFLGEKWDKQTGQCSPATGGLDHGNELVILWTAKQQFNTFVGGWNTSFHSHSFASTHSLATIL